MNFQTLFFVLFFALVAFAVNLKVSNVEDCLIACKDAKGGVHTPETHEAYVHCIAGCHS